MIGEFDFDVGTRLLWEHASCRNTPLVGTRLEACSYYKSHPNKHMPSFVFVSLFIN